MKRVYFFVFMLLTACDIANSSEIKPPKGFKSIHGMTIKTHGVPSIVNGDLFGSGLSGAPGPHYHEEYIMLFDDGSYTDNMSQAIKLGANPTPNKKWRMKGGHISLDGGGRPYLDYQVDPAANNQKLKGCGLWQRGDKTDARTAYKKCFKLDGTFYDMSRNMHETGMKLRSKGKYKIDGYMMELTYDDGQKIQTTFGFLTKKRDSILVNESRFSLTSSLASLKKAMQGGISKRKIYIINRAPSNKSCASAKHFIAKKGHNDVSFETRKGLVTCNDLGINKSSNSCVETTYKLKNPGNYACVISYD